MRAGTEGTVTRREPIYVLTRDGLQQVRGGYFECVRFIHANHAFSFDHAIKFEGYDINIEERADG